jgi:hypothetical protein
VWNSSQSNETLSLTREKNGPSSPAFFRSRNMSCQITRWNLSVDRN